MQLQDAQNVIGIKDWQKQCWRWNRDNASLQAAKHIRREGKMFLVKSETVIDHFSAVGYKIHIALI